MRLEESDTGLNMRGVSSAPEIWTSLLLMLTRGMTIAVGDGVESGGTQSIHPHPLIESHCNQGSDYQMLMQIVQHPLQHKVCMAGSRMHAVQKDRSCRIIRTLRLDFDPKPHDDEFFRLRRPSHTDDSKRPEIITLHLMIFFTFTSWMALK